MIPRNSSGSAAEMNEIWILGATGRSGRAAAAELVGAGFSPVLVGRDASRLREAAAAIDKDLRIVTAGSIDAVVAELSRSRPSVVINTIGPFSATALPVAGACLPGTPPTNSPPSSRCWDYTTKRPSPGGRS